MRILLCALMLLVTPIGGQAQSYPVRPVRIIVPFLPGGAVDMIARVLAQRLTEQLGQQVIVENRAGASGAIGSDAVAKAAPDGYTLLVQSSTLLINPLMVKSTPYEVQRDFTPITQLGSVPMIFVAPLNLPVVSLSEFIALARAKPKSLSFGAASLGSPGHIAMEAIRFEVKLEMQVVPYKGTAGVMNDLLGGHVSGTIDGLPAYLPHVKSGKLKALAVTTLQRVASLKDVPTVAESGIPGFDMVSWYGVWGPAKLPADLLRHLGTETAKAIRSPQALERLGDQGFEPTGTTPDHFAAYVAAEIGKYTRLVKDAKIAVDGN
ncbi:MAG: tripartite tricarboxylate transporter substrate binding protein [Betaproteobacteria bacterium]|nr:tripartite tricarboxylate transporter substrate binding protein [Betaproteobacteria bacterium]